MLTLTRPLLADLYSHLFDAPLPPRFLFGVRGAVPTEPGSLTLEPKEQHLDVCDDAIGFMVDDRGHTYQGSVDPGRHFTQHPMPSAAQFGCAHVIEGHYTFVKGPHKHETRAWKGQNVHCWRDRDRDGRQDPSERREFIVGASIDLHYGGESNTVGEYSAGCQIVRQPHWNTYRDLTYNLFGPSAQYWLIDYNTLKEVHTDGRRPSVTINGVALPKTTPMWVSAAGHVVAIARDLLALLQLDGQSPAIDYQASPTPTIRFHPGDRTVPGQLVADRLVCEVAAVLRAMDPAAGIEWVPGEKQMRVTSAPVKIATTPPPSIPHLQEADDDTPV
jgi:hypothetical protein